MNLCTNGLFLYRESNLCDIVSIIFLSKNKLTLNSDITSGHDLDLVIHNLPAQPHLLRDVDFSKKGVDGIAIPLLVSALLMFLV